MPEFHGEASFEANSLTEIVFFLIATQTFFQSVLATQNGER
jgi:hypothetical protein